MIHQIVTTLQQELNGYLRRHFELEKDTDMVVPGEPAEQARRDENRVVSTLISVEQERNQLNAVRERKKNPPIQLNLYVLYSCFFSPTRYAEGLKYLSILIGFFQGKQVFTPQNTPGFPRAVQKMSVEMVNLDPRELSHFWNALGCSHKPAVLYKMRLTAVSDELILEELPEVRGVDTEKG